MWRRWWRWRRRKGRGGGERRGRRTHLFIVFSSLTIDHASLFAFRDEAQRRGESYIDI